MRAFSYNGELVFSEQSFVKNLYIQKMFGQHPHPAAASLLKTDFFTFKTSAGDLYDKLLNEYKTEIQENVNLYGEVENITDHHIKTNKVDVDFNKIVSTIPLEALAQYVGSPLELPAIDVWYYLVKTSALNFEGAHDVFVVDKPFDFFKVTHVSPQHYLFYCSTDLGNPERYLGVFLNNNLEIPRQTQISKAIPAGVPPNLAQFEAADIYPVGCHGQWDAFMDISSSIKRIHKIRAAHA